jgi:predicted ATPase/DNA-binding winged helix-turn-helix (wHTH) protein
VVFEFGPYRLDDDLLTLTGSEGAIHLEPQVFRVIRHLVANRHRAVPKEELFDTVWGDRFVSESALTSRVKAARRAIGDDGRSQHCIETVHNVGYRFVAEVRVVLGESTVPPSSSAHRRLPALRSTMIGRDDDLVALIETARTARLTTVTGPGGVGKTTLALAAAHHLQAAFSDGAIFVDLTAASSTGDVVRALSDAAGVEGDASRSVERLAEHLAARRLLIVLDNCEHVLGPASDLADRLLSAGTSAHVVATSREPLGAHGEHVRPLDPLDADGPVLFVERARQAEPRIHWDAGDPAIVDLCRRLDGLPLALELAAGQLRRWDFAELSRQLEDRLTPLARGAHRAANRHGTMAAAIDWSYRLLDRSEQRLLRHLSVFPSWFDLRAIEALEPLVPGVVVATTLGELVEKCLVVRDPRGGRYRLLETIRMFAREHLDAQGEAAAAFECHRAHVVSVARRSSRLDRWMSASSAARQRADLEHARQAFHLSLEGGHAADAVEIAVASAFLWRNALGCTEGRTWLDELVALDVSRRDRLWLDILRADLGQGTGNFREMLIAVDDAGRDDDGSDPDATCIVGHYGGLVRMTTPSEASERLHAVLPRAADDRLRTLVSTFLAVTDLAANGPSDVGDRLEELREEASDDGYDAFILHWAGWMDGLLRRDGATASRWMNRQQEFLVRTGIVETWLTVLSDALTSSVDGADVSGRLGEALAAADREGYDVAADCALALAYSEACRGNAEIAAELLGTAIHSRFNATAHFLLHRVVVDPVVRRDLDTAAFDAAVARGERRDAGAVLREYGIAPDAME